MTKPKVSEISSKIYDLLEGLTSDERTRIIEGTLILLGDKRANGPTSPPSSGATATPFASEISPEIHGKFSTRVNSWMKQNNITQAELESVFTITSDGVEVTASKIPGATGKEKTLNCYLLEGLRSLLATGKVEFQDEVARALCDSNGVHGGSNHATYLKEKGNLFGGTKHAGWTLSTPGLVRAAEIIKELSQPS